MCVCVCGGGVPQSSHNLYGLQYGPAECVDAFGWTVMGFALYKENGVGCFLSLFLLHDRKFFLLQIINISKNYTYYSIIPSHHHHTIPCLRSFATLTAHPTKDLKSSEVFKDSDGLINPHNWLCMHNCRPAIKHAWIRVNNEIGRNHHSRVFKVAKLCHAQMSLMDND